MKESSILNPRALARGGLRYAGYGVLLGLPLGVVGLVVFGGDLVYDEQMHARVVMTWHDLLVVPLTGGWYALWGGVFGLVKTVIDRLKLRRKALMLWHSKDCHEALALWDILEKG